jgi:hypothetical protein
VLWWAIYPFLQLNTWLILAGLGLLATINGYLLNRTIADTRAREDARGWLLGASGCYLLCFFMWLVIWPAWNSAMDAWWQTNFDRLVAQGCVAPSSLEPLDTFYNHALLASAAIGISGLGIGLLGISFLARFAEVRKRYRGQVGHEHG